MDHRREVVIRRTRYDLEKAEARAHILEGLRIAIDNIDEVVALIRASASPEEARLALMARFALSEVQARAILDMRLQRLTGLQREELMNEYKELLQKIEFYKSVLENAEVLRGELKREIAEIRETFATPRRTEVLREALTDIDIEDLIPDDEVVITLSRRGYMMTRVKKLRELGAKEVHIRISSPPVKFPCHYGIDFSSKGELIAAQHNLEEITRKLDVDSLHYLSVAGLLGAVSKPQNYCLACFTGDYPVPCEDCGGKFSLESACGSR